MRITDAAPALLTALAASFVLTGCTGLSDPVHQAPRSAVTCDSMLAGVIQRDRTHDTSGLINSELDELARSCPAAADVASDYFGTKVMLETTGVETCDSLRQFTRPEALELLREDGLCTSGDGSAPGAASWPEGGLGWDEAHDHVGTHRRVCGPLASVRETEDGVFVNIGRDYPSPDRFTFVIWGGWSLDPVDTNATVCAAGTIYDYRGVPQIKLNSPAALELWQ